jgi:hypothetical protein
MRPSETGIFILDPPEQSDRFFARVYSGQTACLAEQSNRLLQTENENTFSMLFRANRNLIF